MNDANQVDNKPAGLDQKVSIRQLLWSQGLYLLMVPIIAVVYFILRLLGANTAVVVIVSAIVAGIYYKYFVIPFVKKKK